MIALGCDHGGFNLITAIKKHFDEQGIAYKDFGTYSEDSRRHNHANILCMGGRVTSVEDALRFTDIFLNTPEEGGRHDKRVAMLTELDNGRTSFD